MRKSGFWALALLVGLIATVAFADISGDNVKVVKQVGGGSTGDSLTAAADTSYAIKLPRNLKTLYVLAAADSQSIYKTQVSYDGTYWYTVDTDTVAAGSAELTADLTSGYAGLYLRVIMDPIPAAASPYGAAIVNFTTER